MKTDVIEKGLFGYPAGKSAMAKGLAAMMPEHKTYVEPFVGSGAVLFAKEKSDVEVVNDSNEDVAGAWRTLSELSLAQIEQLKGMDWAASERKFKAIKAASPADAVKRLHRFLYLARFSRQNGRQSFNSGNRAIRPPAFQLIGRVRGVRSFCGDYEKVCRKYDGADTFFFFDPPYAGYDGGVGEAKFDEARFFKFLTSLKGNWLLTYGVRGKLPGMLRASKFTVKSWSINRNLQNNPGDGAKKLGQIYASNYGAVKKSAFPGEHWPSLLVPDPEHLVKRLDGGQVAGVLTTAEQAGGVSKALALVNYDQRLAQSWGVVELRKGVKFPTGARAVEVLGGKVCTTTAAVFKGLEGEVWFHPLDLVEQWDPQAINHAQKAVWTTEEINDLPDASFLYIEPGGEKDADGKTVPRTLRHFPIRDGDGELDLPHLRNAISRIPQAKIPGLSAEDLQGLQDKARRLLEEETAKAQKADDEKDLRELSDEDLEKLTHLLGAEYHRAQAEGAGEAAMEEIREAKLAVLAELKRRGMELPDWAQQKSVNVAKGLSAKQEAEYQAENKKIAEAKKAPAAAKAHQFRAAKFTHPNGHPRCLVCGDEETVGGWCNDASRDAVEARKAESFSPMAKVRPQQAKAEYAGADDALGAFATEKALSAGVAVEPLIKGAVVVVHRQARGDAVEVRIDGAADGEAAAVKESLEKLEANAVLVGALAGDKLHVTDMLYWDADAVGAMQWHERAAKRAAVFGRDTGAITNVVGRVVHGGDALKTAVKWAMAAPGSSGAVLKLSASPYQQGGAGNEAVVKVAKIVNVVVYERTDGGELKCAIGPIPENEINEWAATVELNGRRYAPIGSVDPGGIEAKQGDVVRVSVSAIDTVDTAGKRAITWSAAIAQERVQTKPSTAADVQANQTTKKLTKATGVFGSVRRPVQILKSVDEEQFILGVVLEPNDGTGEAPLDPDAHSDIYSEPDIRKACHLYFAEHGRTGLEHQRELDSTDVQVVENYVTPFSGEINGQAVRKGAWMIGAYVLNKELWGRVKSGELNAWSIDGEAARTPAGKP